MTEENTKSVLDTILDARRARREKAENQRRKLMEHLEVYHEARYVRSDLSEVRTEI